MSLYLGNVSVSRTYQATWTVAIDRVDRQPCRDTASQRQDEAGQHIASTGVQVISDQNRLPPTSPDASLYRHDEASRLIFASAILASTDLQIFTPGYLSPQKAIIAVVMKDQHATSTTASR